MIIFSSFFDSFAALPHSQDAYIEKRFPVRGMQYNLPIIKKYTNILVWIINKKWMKGENMVKKKVFDDAAVVAALRRGHRQELYFEQIAAFRH
jgi:hypothetical protein